MRPPDKIIGENYLARWELIPRRARIIAMHIVGKWRYRRIAINAYLHKFTGSDDDRACHCHPWLSVSFLLWPIGGLLELSPFDTEDMREVFPGTEVLQARAIPWLRPVVRSAEFRHRLVLSRGPTYTLFITAPARRKWGFWCWSASGYSFRPWREFTTRDGRAIGGCE